MSGTGMLTLPAIIEARGAHRHADPVVEPLLRVVAARARRGVKAPSTFSLAAPELAATPRTMSDARYLRDRPITLRRASKVLPRGVSSSPRATQRPIAARASRMPKVRASPTSTAARTSTTRWATARSSWDTIPRRCSTRCAASCRGACASAASRPAKRTLRSASRDDAVVRDELVRVDRHRGRASLRCGSRAP